MRLGGSREVVSLRPRERPSMGEATGVLPPRGVERH